MLVFEIVADEQGVLQPPRPSILLDCPASFANTDAGIAAIGVAALAAGIPGAFGLMNRDEADVPPLGFELEKLLLQDGCFQSLGGEGTEETLLPPSLRVSHLHLVDLIGEQPK